MVLSMVHKGHALELIKGAPLTRGFEAWRRLVQKFEMRQTAALIRLGALLNVDFGA